MTSVEIVDALVDPTEAGALIQRSFDYKPAGRMPDLVTKQVEQRIEIEKIVYLIGLVEPPKYYILARDQNKLVGFGIVSESNLQHFYDLTWVCVDKNYRCQGLGKRITSKAVDFAAAKDRNIIITTDAPKFYTDLGFTTSSEFRTGWYLMLSPTLKEKL
jgi:predicted N-acetyltransferase YhbS